MKHEVFQVMCLIRRSGKTALHQADLIFIEGQPYIVIEWLSGPGIDIPDVKVPLDPKLLHKLPSPDRVYSYENPIDDPRPLH